MMVSKKTIFALLAVMVMGAISLAGCSSNNPAASTPLPAYYVNAATGADTNAGTQAAPFKTITKALATASTGISLNIFVAAGTYDAANGEVFPIKIASTGVNLIGTGTPLISGAGPYAVTAGDIAGPAFSYAVVFTPGVTATMTGFAVNGSQETIGFDGATVTLTNNTASGSTDVVMPIANGANVTLTNNSINNGNWGILVVDASTTAKLRGNTIITAGQNSIVIGLSIPVPVSVINLGTAADPGNNIIQGGTGVGLYLAVITAGGNVNASGNTWKANVQGADAQGHYATGLLIASGTALVGGNNYANPNNGGIQFYTQAGGTGTQISY